MEVGRWAGHLSWNKAQFVTEANSQSGCRRIVSQVARVKCNPPSPLTHFIT